MTCGSEAGEDKKKRSYGRKLEKKEGKKERRGKTTRRKEKLSTNIVGKGEGRKKKEECKEEGLVMEEIGK